ncbi:ABC transporter ATP-binding protein [Halobellus limi]|uniref:ABC-type D-xylose/L-arabinose transporter n=2 Tax=Halobellus limi TaxID=699433 RepID=A0A1H6BQS6_9EURY|nr:ABC transporter ATP-binding protein [Halobellus limi]SEG63058.1 multiple sugar transport system ATP-binding protein [Halobellus limi]
MAMEADSSSTKDDIGDSVDAGKGTIRMENIRKTFDNGEIVACADINLEINPTDFVVLLGPSGCGKTTTLRCLSGLDVPDSGHIYIGDEEMTYEKPKDRDLAFVFQSIALFPHMSVRKNIAFGLDMTTDMSKDEKNERVREVAEMLGIESMLDRSPDELSGGQQQRVSLGRAMVMEPAAFLLDEPFSALDAKLRDQMRVEVKQLQRELETAMIFVTHDQEEAMTLGDKIVVMDDARIQQIGSPYEIYNEPTNQFVASFIGSPSTNMLPVEVVSTGEGYDVVGDFFRFPLSDEQVDRYQGGEQGNVQLGVRPEYLQLDADEKLFDADVSVIEPHGARDAVHLTADDYDLTAVTPQEKIPGGTESVSVDFEIDQIWLFDGDGQRLL